MTDEPVAASVKNIARMFDVSETTIRDAINKQQLPAFRVGRAIRVFIDDAKAWLKAQTRVGSEDDQ